MSDDDPELTALLAELWQESRTGILERAGRIRELTAWAAAGDDLAGDEWDEVVHEAHKLAGSLGSLGLPEGTDIAREIEQAIRRGAGPAEFPALAGLGARLEQVIAARS